MSAFLPILIFTLSIVAFGCKSEHSAVESNRTGSAQPVAGKATGVKARPDAAGTPAVAGSAAVADSPANSPRQRKSLGAAPVDPRHAGKLLNGGEGCPAGTTIQELRRSWSKEPLSVWCERPDGNRHGPFVSVRDRVGFYREGLESGRWTIWHRTDLGEPRRKWAEGAYRQGKRHGRWTWWWGPAFSEKVRKQCEGSFRDGKPVGRWRAWTDSGELVEDARWYAETQIDARLERWVNGGEREDFQSALNLIYPLSKRERRVWRRAFRHMVRTSLATDGAGISQHDAERLLAAIGDPPPQTPGTVQEAMAYIRSYRITPAAAAAAATALAVELGAKAHRPIARALNSRGHTIYASGGLLDDALVLTRAAAAIDASYGMPRYNSARILALKGEAKRCIEYLNQLRGLGKGQRVRLDRARKDPDFSSVHNVPAFTALFR